MACSISGQEVTDKFNVVSQFKILKINKVGTALVLFDLEWMSPVRLFVLESWTTV